MKPQIIMQDFGGAHNNDLSKTTARLMRGGSWKKQRIVCILPSADLISAKVALSHWNLAWPPNNGVLRILALGDEVGVAYSQAIESVLANPDLSQWEFLLTLESDNSPPSDGVIKLVEKMEEHKEFAWISGLYYTKGAGGCAQIWGDIRDPVVNFRPQLPDINGGLVECYGTGMGFALWRLSMFKDTRLRKPWFHTQTKDGVSTQDLYFASDARKFGYRCAVDCSCKVGHYDLEGKYGPPDTMW